MVSRLATSDESIHAIGSEPDWREAFYFDFVDPASRLTGFGYSGVHPNQQTGDVIFALWRQDELLSRFTRWDFNIPANIGEERLDFGPLCFRPLTPMQTWEMLFDDGYCRLQLRFDAIHRPYFWADSERALAKTSSHHYEQQGRYAGVAKTGGKETPVRGVGVRDHAWGWGARASIRRWLWASAQFDSAFAFNAFHVGLGDGRDVHYGYLFRGADNVFLRRSRLSAGYAQTGQAPAAVRVEAEGRDGQRVAATGCVINAFNISHQERNKQGYHYFCATEYECEGRKGYGHTNFFWHDNSCRPTEWEVTGP